MSYRTHKAIGEMRKWKRKTAEMVEEAVRRFEAVKTESDLADVLDWAREFGWYLRTEEQDKRMNAAYMAAQKRAAQ